MIRSVDRGHAVTRNNQPIVPHVRITGGEEHAEVRSDAGEDEGVGLKIDEQPPSAVAKKPECLGLAMK